MNTQVTLCLTMGKRPELLKQTLNSLFQFQQFEHVIAINDFGDEETNQAFKEVCPHGQLLDLGRQVGHHPAVDAMYELIKTPYVFHCEDDWLFTRSPDIEQAMRLLESPNVSTACFRRLDLDQYAERDVKRIVWDEYQGVRYYHLDRLHSQWHGYGFNPHLAKLSLWRSCGHFAHFKNERHISRFFRKQGLHVAMMYDGSCEHIGDDLSVSHENTQKPISRVKQLRRKVKYFILDLFGK